MWLAMYGSIWIIITHMKEEEEEEAPISHKKARFCRNQHLKGTIVACYYE